MGNRTFFEFLFWTLCNLISDPLVFVWVIYQIPFLRRVGGCARTILGSLPPFYKNKVFPVGLKRSRIFASLRRNLSKCPATIHLE